MDVDMGVDMDADMDVGESRSPITGAALGGSGERRDPPAAEIPPAATNDKEAAIEVTRSRADFVRDLVHSLNEAREKKIEEQEEKADKATSEHLRLKTRLSKLRNEIKAEASRDVHRPRLSAARKEAEKVDSELRKFRRARNFHSHNVEVLRKEPLMKTSSAFVQAVAALEFPSAVKIKVEEEEPASGPPKKKMKKKKAKKSSGLLEDMEDDLLA
eukprot:g6692.t1